MALATPDVACERELAPRDAVAQRYALRSVLRGIGLDLRQRACGTYVAGSAGAALIFSGQPGNWRSSWSGLMTCGKIWTCPVCSARLRAKRLAKVKAALVGMGGRWQMLTFTIRHHDGEELRPMFDKMMLALAKMRRGRSVRAIWLRAVTASIRATEVKFGRHGFHPHLHILLRVLPLSSKEKTTLRHEWRAYMARALGMPLVDPVLFPAPPKMPKGYRTSAREKDERNKMKQARQAEALRLGLPLAPSLAFGLRFSKALDVDKCKPDKLAGYIVKLGCEIVGHGKDAKADARNKGSLSQWELASLAAAREPREWRAWTEFQIATKGRRMIELDDRAAHAAKGPRLPFITAQDKRDFDDEDLELRVTCDDEPAPITKELDVTQDELHALRRWEWEDRQALARPLAAARRADDPIAAARAVIDECVKTDGPRREREIIRRAAYAARGDPARAPPAPS